MQISIMPLSRSGSVSKVSRWSTAPVEHPGATGAAEALLAGVRRVHTRAVQRRKQCLVGADPDRLAGGRDRDRELGAVDDRRRGEPLEVQLDVVPADELGSNRRQHRCRTARVDRGAVRAVAEQLRRPLASR